jgi:hypothetical protein
MLYNLVRYNLELEIIRQDFMSGIDALLKKNPIKAIFLGTRIADPNAVRENLAICHETYCYTLKAPSFWFLRLVRSSSLQAQLDGLPLCVLTQFWIGHTGSRIFIPMSYLLIMCVLK